MAASTQKRLENIESTVHETYAGLSLTARLSRMVSALAADNDEELECTVTAEAGRSKQIPEKRRRGQ